MFLRLAAAWSSGPYLNGILSSVAGLSAESGAFRMPAAQPALNLLRISLRMESGMKSCQPSTISFRNVGDTVLMKWAAKMPDAWRSTGFESRDSK